MYNNFERLCSCAEVVKKGANHDDRNECDAGSGRRAALSRAVVRALASPEALRSEQLYQPVSRSTQAVSVKPAR